MAYSFEEIMAYHPDNITVYEEIRRKIAVLSPFIGAGFTQFSYYSWADALRQLVSKITEQDGASRVLSFIDTKQYLKAAKSWRSSAVP